MAFLRNTLLTAGVAAVATTLASLVLGERECGDAAAPLNATSHILWGNEAVAQDGFSTEYTLAGAALNAAAMVGWAAIQEFVAGRWVRRGGAARAVVAGGVTSAVAYATDYHVVPERLTPGFEKRLSPGALTAMYGVLAASLALSVRLGRERR